MVVVLKDFEMTIGILDNTDIVSFKVGDIFPNFLVNDDLIRQGYIEINDNELLIDDTSSISFE